MRRSVLYARILLSLLLTALLLAPQSGHVWAAAPEQPLPPDAVAIPAAAQIATEVGLAHQMKTPEAIESSLVQLEAAYATQNTAALDGFAGGQHVDLAAGTVRVILEMAVDPEAQHVGDLVTEAVVLTDGRRGYVEHAPQIAIRHDLTNAIEQQGAQYETAYEDRVQVLAPIESITALAQIPGVRWVRLPYPATTTDLSAQAGLTPDAPQVGSRTSEGVPLTLASSWHNKGYTGADVNVAIFDLGFTGWQGLQATGDLPSGGNLVLKDYSSIYNFSPDTPGWGHGSACAEIVRDMAPGSKLYLYAFWTDVELGNAINDYRNSVTGKRVATMSIGYVNAGPYDGTGAINTMINNAQGSGILWVNSAGNQQRSHWSGTSTQYQGTDSVAFGGDTVLGLGPSPGDFEDYYGNSRITFYLEWNDWNAARTGNQNRVDYDVGLYRRTGSTWQLVAVSAANQCETSAPPVEAISYLVPAGGPYQYGLSIFRYVTGGCTNNFGHWLQAHSFLSAGGANLFWYVNQCNSLLIPGDGDSAMTAGATFWNADGVPPLYGLESFSSLGPRNVPGGGNPGTTVNKPDVVAPDGVSGVIYGLSNGTPSGGGFFGTSASAPHVAGIAALVWSRHPSYSQANVRSYIQNHAFYRADGGACGGTSASASNNRFGYGRIMLPGPIPAFLPLVVK